MWHLHTRQPICLRILTNSFCRSWRPGAFSLKGYFRKLSRGVFQEYAARRRKGGKNAAISIIAGLCETTWVTSNTGVTHNFSGRSLREDLNPERVEHLIYYRRKAGLEASVMKERYTPNMQIRFESDQCCCDPPNAEREKESRALKSWAQAVPAPS